MGDEECFGMGAYGRSGSGAGWIGWWLRWRDVEQEREREDVGCEYGRCQMQQGVLGRGGSGEEGEGLSGVRGAVGEWGWAGVGGREGGFGGVMRDGGVGKGKWGLVVWVEWEMWHGRCA